MYLTDLYLALKNGNTEKAQERLLSYVEQTKDERAMRVEATGLLDYLLIERLPKKKVVKAVVKKAKKVKRK